MPNTSATQAARLSIAPMMEGGDLDGIQWVVGRCVQYMFTFRSRDIVWRRVHCGLVQGMRPVGRRKPVLAMVPCYR